MTAKYPSRKRHMRVVRMRKASAEKAGGGLWHIDASAKVSGLRLLQNDDGEVFLTRASEDGFVQPYALRGHDDKPLRVERKYRP